jgi:general stress protein 26
MVGLRDGSSHSEPLTAQLDKDQVDTLWFFIGKDNRLAKGGDATVNFVAKGQDFFASLSGTATVDNNLAMIDKLWSRQVEALLPGGKADPNLVLLRFDISTPNFGRQMFLHLAAGNAVWRQDKARVNPAMRSYRIRPFNG